MPDAKDALANRTQPIPTNQPDAPNVTDFVCDWLLENSLFNAVGEIMLIDDLCDRDVMGIAKYGTPLQPNNGRDATLDAYQEGCDMLKYLVQSILEKGGNIRHSFAPQLVYALIEMRWELKERYNE